MNNIGIRRKIRLFLDKLFAVDRRDEYGYMAKSAYLAPDTMLFNKRNLFMEEGTSIPGGAMILNPRSKFIMKKGSFSSYNLCVCPGNHMVVKGMWKHDATNEIKDKLDANRKLDKDIVVEEDVWLGINVTLLNGCHIGRGSIVGAGCVVTGFVPPYSVVVGNPYRIVKFVFTPEEIVEHEKMLYPEDKRLPLELLEENYLSWIRNNNKEK